MIIFIPIVIIITHSWDEFGKAGVDACCLVSFSCKFVVYREDDIERVKAWTL